MCLRFDGTRFEVAIRSRSSRQLCITKYLTQISFSANFPLTMSAPEPIRPAPRAPIPIDARAADHLRYIRETMASAGEFTAVPGWGGIAMGTTALVAAVVASRQHTPERWLSIWLVEAFVAVAIAMPAAATKAHRANA